LLCLKYCEQNSTIKICPNLACGNIIDVAAIDKPFASCLCGAELCKRCGKDPHWPLECADFGIWQKLVRENDSEGPSPPTLKKCPVCRQIIDKGDGCLLMTCICTHQFCWRCLKQWTGHRDFFECSEELRAVEREEENELLQANKRFN
jgi:ariadne-1